MISSICNPETNLLDFHKGFEQNLQFCELKFAKITQFAKLLKSLNLPKMILKYRWKYDWSI